MLPAQLTGSPAGQVLSILQRDGAATVKHLEGKLGVTATAVRQQIAGLLLEGYVQQGFERAGRGRPKHVYSLTTKGRAVFPRHYDEFTSSLLREILVSEGPEKVHELLTRMSRRLAEQYEREMAGLAHDARPARLAELLTAKGILAEVRLEPEGAVFCEYTCPYYELAREHREICEMEERMIAQVLRRPVTLVSCMLDGHHGCRFRIESETETPPDRS